MARYDGTEGSDVWQGKGEDDVAFGYAGNDRLYGGRGNDEIHGDDGDDTLDGGYGVDWVDGGAGDDYLSVTDETARPGDRFTGGTGLDTLGVVGGIGVTVDLTRVIIDSDIEHIDVFGSLLLRAEQLSSLDVRIQSNTTYIANSGLADLRGIDLTFSRLVLSQDGNKVVLNGSGQSLVEGQAGDDVIIDRRIRDDGPSADRLDGGAGDDQVTVTNGDNTGGDKGLFGGAGDDRLHGGSGADSLNGGTDQDRLTGGRGADLFVFVTGDTAVSADDADRITDFSRTEGDKIDLRGYDAVPGNSTLDPFVFIGTDAFDGDSGEIRYEFSGRDTLVSGDTNGDKVADFTIRLSGNLGLYDSDFLFAGEAAADLSRPALVHPDLSANPLLHLA